MQHLKMILVGLTLLSFIVSPLAMAQSTDQGILLAELQRQVDALKAQIAELQRFLAQFPDIFPEALITGFFGELTEKAVKRFQKKHGIEQAGIVGPKTRGRLIALFVEHNGATTTLLLPPGLAKKLIRQANDDDDHEDADDHKNKGKGRDRDAREAATTTPHGATSTPDRAHKIIVCHKEKHTITISSSAWPAHQAHSDTLGACVDGNHDDEDDDDATTTPDRTAPVITGLAATSTATTTATIVWNTNEPATSKVLYGTSTPITNANSSMVINNTLVTAHSLALSGLSASTTYYSLAISWDAAGNTATSSELSFTTFGE